MKTVVVSLNSKYIHSSLAPWYLKAACQDADKYGQVEVREFTINDDQDMILARLYEEQPDILAFCCYIWNIGHTLRLTENLKAVLPEVFTVFGGPEVSYDPEQMLKEHNFIDCIICGEGEKSFPRLLASLIEGQAGLASIGGLAFREGDAVISTGAAECIADLDAIASPYTDEMLKAVDGRIVYFESSRGCPFSCSYCLSSIEQGVRYFTMSRVKNELSGLFAKGMKQVKFVDRTFNANRRRAAEIIRFVIENGGDTNVHFEAAADLFDDDLINLLASAPPGRIQLEIGVQTTNSYTLESVSRKTDLDVLFSNVQRLREKGNIHIHLDLIAGLPLEDISSFEKSFNDVYSLHPHNLQLGFLKMLKGSRMRREAEQWGYKYRSYPPYEVLENQFVTFNELLILKGIEEVLERFHNSGRFVNTLEYIEANKTGGMSFDFYRGLYLYCKEMGCLDRPLAARENYAVMLEYLTGRCNVEHVVAKDLLKLDFLLSDSSGSLPAVLADEVSASFRQKCFDFLRSRDNVNYYLPRMVDLPAKQIYKQVHFELFKNSIGKTGTGKMGTVLPFAKTGTILLFDYTIKYPVTELYRYVEIDL